jgi:uncharacterized protein
MSPEPDLVVCDTRRWLERAVIGLNLCPFAKAVHVRNRIHFAVSKATQATELLGDLAVEMDALLASDAAVRDTTLLIAPGCLDDFLDFSAFLHRGERLIRKRGLAGIVQLASFHPDYRFAGTEADDVGNCTNRSPYPTLHLLREDSIARAVVAFPEAEGIYQANIETLRRLGPQGWTALGVGPSG